MTINYFFTDLINQKIKKQKGCLKKKKKSKLIKFIIIKHKHAYFILLCFALFHKG